MKFHTLFPLCIVLLFSSCMNQTQEEKVEEPDTIKEQLEEKAEEPKKLENQAENSQAIYEMSVQSSARENLPTSISKLIPKDENLVLDIENESAFIFKKDVNGDGLEDWIIPTHKDNNIRLAIFHNREVDYLMAGRTGWIVCPQQYNNFGNFGDNLVEISDKSVISWHLFWARAEVDLKFRYEEEERNYYLIGLEYLGRGADSYSKTSINYITGKKIETEGKIGAGDSKDIEKTSNISNPTPEIGEVNDDMLYRDLN